MIICNVDALEITENYKPDNYFKKLYKFDCDEFFEYEFLLDRNYQLTVVDIEDFCGHKFVYINKKHDVSKFKE